MILVDVYAPSVDESWDFMLDENTKNERIIYELVEMISRKITSGQDLDSDNFRLYSLVGACELPKESTLAECGIRDGCKLMLV